MRLSLTQYLPELITVILLAVLSSWFTYNVNQTRILEKKLETLNALQSAIPQHELQVLNVNFSDQVHYDNYAQAHALVESLTLELDDSLPLVLDINQYLDSTSTYIQFVTVLKTSLRLISHFELTKKYDQTININLIKTDIFAYLHSPSEVARKTLISQINHFKSTINQHEHNGLKLFWAHVDFVLNNFSKTAEMRRTILSLPIHQIITDAVVYDRKQNHEYRLYLYLCLALMVFVVLALFITILKKQQNKLINASKDLENALEVKSQFLANMSHEIRTPMTGIIGLVELCLLTELTDEQKSYLEKVDFSAKSLLTIINDILDFSKIESGQLPIEHVPFKHNQVVESLNMMLGRVAEDKQIELIFDVDPEVPEVVVADPVRINQVVLNILGNAVKFTANGHVIMRVRLEVCDNQQFLQYEVEDTGIGLSPEQQNKLFQRFAQADDSTTRKYGGTGLGLAISKLLVELMGGKIWVTSELNVGSVFHIKLPIETERINDTAVDYNDLTVLLIEDYSITQDVIAKMAAFYRVSIDIASNVSDAVAFTKEKKYDLALIDWNLKEDSGIDYIKAVKNALFCPSLMIICSAYSKEYINEHSNIQFDGHYLPKPISLESLGHAFEHARLVKRGIVTDGLEIKNRSDQELQANAANEGSELAGPNAPSVKRQTSSNPNQQKILLVEDNKINQIVATNLLTKLGLDVDLAENGQEALELVEKNDYQVVLMDVQMPVMDGMEATKILRQSYTVDDLFIVALTANITEEEIAYYQNIGMNAHLGKPYEMDKITALLSQFYSLSSDLTEP